MIPTTHIYLNQILEWCKKLSRNFQVYFFSEKPVPLSSGKIANIVERVMTVVCLTLKTNALGCLKEKILASMFVTCKGPFILFW